METNSIIEKYNILKTNYIILKLHIDINFVQVRM